MELKKVKTIDVKRSFILAEAMKRYFNPEDNFSFEALTNFYYDLIGKYSKISQLELNRIINGLELGKTLEEVESNPRIGVENGDRIKRYNELSWSYGLVELNKIGAWPEMRGIAPDLTAGSIVETARAINFYSLGELSYQLSDERKNKLNKLLELIEPMKKSKFIFKLPLILVPGESIRGESYKKWVMENHGNYQEHDTSLFGIDNGNARALAHVFLGKEETFSYVGEYKN